MNLCEAMKKATGGYCTVRLSDLENDMYTVICAGDRDRIVSVLRKECGEIKYSGTTAGIYTVSDLTAGDWIIMRKEELELLAEDNASGAHSRLSEAVADKPITEAVAQFCNAAKTAGFETEARVRYADGLPTWVEITARS